MNELAILDGPVLGWVAGGVTADGVLDAELGPNWRGNPCAAPACAGWARRPPALGRRWKPVVEAEHTAPAPFCGCGLGVYPDEPAGRWGDRYKDRLGYRMQTAALAITWGRVIVERDCVRGEHGRVLALLVSSDEPPRRCARIEHAARQLGAALVSYDAGRRPDFQAIAARIGAPHGRRMERSEAAGLLRDRSLRRWHPRDRSVDHGEAIQQMIIGGATIVGLGLSELGVPAYVLVPALGIPTVGLSLRALRHTMRGLVQVEALAAAPDGRQVGRPIELVPGRATLQFPTRGGGDWIRDEL